MSVFILSGAELKATATLEGPVAPPDVDLGTTLMEATERFRRGERFGDHMIVEEVVDFEHLQEEIKEDDVEEDEEEPPEGEDPEARRARIQKNRERIKQRRQKELARKEKVQQKVRSAGEPYQVTMQAKSAGWYRACVRGTWYQVRTNWRVESLFVISYHVVGVTWYCAQLSQFTLLCINADCRRVGDEKIE
jgi:hypothetical protein